MSLYRSDLIKQIPIVEVVQRYGFTPNRGGFISCPFHEEKTPSLKIDSAKNRWKCYGCDKGGTAIDFVMYLFNMTFIEAVDKIGGDFGIADKKPDPKEVREYQAKMERQRMEDELWNLIYDRRVKRYYELWQVYKNGTPDDPLYETACKELPFLDDWFERCPYGTNRKNRWLW